MEKAKLFKNGQSQAVRLPKALRMRGKEVYAAKVGQAVVLTPADDPWCSLRESLGLFSKDFMADRSQPKVERSVRADLERRGKPIGALDTMIAAHVVALGATLVTNNVREFSRVRGLNVENWAA